MVPDERVEEPDDERVAAPEERLVELEDLVVVPDEERVVEPDERVVLPLLIADDDLRDPELLTVPALDERVVLLVLLTARELADLEDEELVARVTPVEASLDPTDLLETDLVPEDSATDLDEALLTAAETPSTLREEPVVAKEPEVREAAVEPAPALARVVPPLRP